MKTVLIAALATITMAGGLNAQQSGHCQAAGDSSGNQMRSGAMMGMMQGRMMEEGMMQGGMMSMMASGTLMRQMRFAPKRVKALGDSLDLTAEQVAGLDQLVELGATAHRDLMTTARAAAEKLTELFDGETVDSAAVRSAALDAFEPQAAMHAQMLVDAAVVRGILTAAQGETVTAMANRSPATNHCGRGGQ